MTIRILLVEDNLEKRRLVIEAALMVDGVTEQSFEYALDVIAAKRLLKAIRFDLVILDINLPKKPNSKAEVGAGLDILHFLKTNAKAIAPVCLFGLTACDDSIAMAGPEFLSPLWKLVRFSHSEEIWQLILKEGLIYLLGLKRPPYFNDGGTYHSDLAIITALREELDKVLELPASWEKIEVPHDYSAYYKGRFTNSTGDITVIATSAPGMGMPAAAVSASKLIHNFRPKILAMTGICAGIRGKCEIGDILVADPCFDWGSGKWIEDGENDLKFRPALYPWRLDTGIRSKIESTADKLTLKAIHQEFTGNKPSHHPACKIDAMASGGSVLQAASLVEDVKDLHKNLIGLEMESYAVFSAAEHAADPKPLCISIKSVCDFGDRFKSDDYHEYAAYTSARFLFEFALKHLIESDD